MKKCPKCGTILDDSKTKCYMCGENLGVGGSVSFLDSVDNDIGATISSNQDNVFNNGEDIEVLNLEEVAQPQEEAQTFVSHSSSSRDIYGSEINQLNMGNNSGSVDNYNPFVDDQIPTTPQVMPQQPAPVPELPPANLPPVDQFQPVQPLPVANAKPEKPPKPPKEKKPIPKAMIFNTICFIIFMGLIIFAYFKFIRKEDNENVRLNSLTYTIDPRFTLQDNSSEVTANTYKYGEECVVKLEYGFTNDTEEAEDKYINSVIKQYETSLDMIAGKEEYKVKGNTWKTVSFYYVKKGEGDNLEADKSKLRYQYMTVLHNGSLYKIQYFNPTSEEECETMYQTFKTTLYIE